MGGVMSCKRSKKKKSFTECNQQNYPRNPNPKAIILGKNRKIIQKDKELYQVVFEADGFSVHDLALLGQKNSPESIIQNGVAPRRIGRVELLNDVTDLITKKVTPTQSVVEKSQKSQKSQKTSSHHNLDSSKETFEIVEIQDYVDDLYLQLLEPAMDGGEEPKDTTSTTETTKSGK